MDAYSLGQFLRSSREAKAIALEEAVAHLRIRQPILEAFEAGDFAAVSMPEIQLRGMLRNYARYLELDEEDVLRLYDEARSRMGKRRRWLWRGASRSRGARGQPPPMQEIGIQQRRSSRWRSLLRFFLQLSISIAALMTIAYVTLQLIDAPGHEDLGRSTALPNAQITVLPAETVMPPPTWTPAAAVEAVNRAVYSGSGILVSILVTHRNWIRVVVDGEERYAGIARPETLLEYNGHTEITARASSAMGLDILWNGKPQGQMGGRGQLIDLRFTTTEVDVKLGAGAAPTIGSPTTRATSLAAMTSNARLPADTPVLSPTATFTPRPTETLTMSPPPSFTPSQRPTSSDTPTKTKTPTNAPTLAISISPTETAILPPRVARSGLMPTKEGA